MPRRLFHLRPWRRHSIVLAVSGGAYVAYGISLMTLPLTPDREQALVLATNIMSLAHWGWMWVLVGALAIASTRWPPQSETWGYGAMSGVTALWGSLYLLGMPFREHPTASVPGALVFALITFLWWAVSGLMNPDDPEPHVPIKWDWTIYAPTHRGDLKPPDKEE